MTNCLLNRLGLLCITCTDLAVLCGNNPEACFAKYASMPLHTQYAHEMVLFGWLGPHIARLSE